MNEKKDTKKYSKLKKFFSSLYDIGLLSTIVYFGTPEVLAATKSIMNYKNNVQVMQDAKLFEADMHIAEIFSSLTKWSSTYKRLPYNEGKPIYISVTDNYTPREIEILQNVLDYYEGLFESINPKYKFEIISQKEARLESFVGNTVVFFDKMDSSYAVAQNGVRSNFFNGNMIKKSQISMPYGQYSDDITCYLFTHELAHSFGLGDVYERLTPINHADTLLNLNYSTSGINMLFPNDVAILYALYGESYRDGDKILLIELNNSQNSFENYKKEFYTKLTSILKKELKITNAEEIEATNFSFAKSTLEQETYTVKSFRYGLSLGEGQTAKLYIKDNSYNLLEVIETNYIKEGNILLFPSVVFPNGQYPNLSKESSKAGTYSFAIYSEDGNLKYVDIENLKTRTVTAETNVKSEQKTEEKRALEI